jgi:glycosyltransferase involved in cell wall biosynthesis
MGDINTAVIMSVYINDALFQIKEAVNSVKQQTLPCHLYVVADGPVCDEVHNYFLSQASNKNDNNTFNLYYFPRMINRGLAHSLNELISYVLTSENSYAYVARMDADDICFPERIQKQAEYLNVYKNVDVLGTGCHEFSSSNKHVFTKILPEQDAILKRDLIKKCPFVHPSVTFRINVFRDGMRYPTDTRFTEDYAFWVLLAVRGYIFGNIEEALIKFRFEDDVLLRRRGLNKANSEFTARLSAMKELSCFSMRNVFYSCAIWGLRVIPVSLARFAYKKMR